MQCHQCDAAVTEEARFCSRCGAPVVRALLQADSHVPQCPRCGDRVRAPDDGPFPKQRPGLISATPWNEGWDGVCQRCGLRFAAEHVLNTRQPGGGWGFIRRAVFEHGQMTEWQGLDFQLHVAGISITIETVPWRGEHQRERVFLTVAEAQALCRAREGPLRILTEQRDWMWDTT